MAWAWLASTAPVGSTENNSRWSSCLVLTITKLSSHCFRQSSAPGYFSRPALARLKNKQQTVADVWL